MKILPDENEFAVNKIYGLKSVAVMIITLLLVSYGLIGGCNNNSSTQMADALKIGELSGPIVPAVDAEFFIRDWQEGDSNNNFFLQGSMAGKLTQTEQDALRSAYKSGFYIALIHPTIAEIYDLDDVLGLEEIIVDNGPLDIFAVKRELVGGGIRRYFTLPNKQQNLEPRDLSIERERVTALMDWHNMQAPLLGQEGGSSTNELNQLAHTWSNTHTLLDIEARKTMGIYVSDFQGTFSVTYYVIAVHSELNNNDVYYFYLQYELAPNTILKTSSTAPWGCQQAFLNEPLIFMPDSDLRGVNNYQMNHTYPAGTSVNLVSSSPDTSTCTSSTSSSIMHSIDGSLSYATDDGEGVGVSEGVSYSSTQTFNCPAVQIQNFSKDGPDKNNTAWTFSVFDTNAATATFQPPLQWYITADPSTRTQFPCSVKEEGMQVSTFCLPVTIELTVSYYPYSCLGNVTPINLTSATVNYTFNVPIPPLPPPPTPTPTPPSCTMDSDCPVGQQCATDLMPPTCQPLQCDASMLCPAGFQCINEECQPNP